MMLLTCLLILASVAGDEKVDIRQGCSPANTGEHCSVLEASDSARAKLQPKL